MHEQYIEKIIMSEDDNKMHELKNVLVDVISYMAHNNPSVYNKIECDLYEIAEGKVLSRQKAEQWVNSMVPKAKWSMKDIERIKNSKEISIPLVPAYTIMNMLYSDFSDVLGEENTEEVIDKYIKAAEDWYYDEDAKNTEEAKLYEYWKNIVN